MVVSFIHYSAHALHFIFEMSRVTIMMALYAAVM